jgi:hypothetical protein
MVQGLMGRDGREQQANITAMASSYFPELNSHSRIFRIAICFTA